MGKQTKVGPYLTPYVSTNIVTTIHELTQINLNKI